MATRKKDGGTDTRAGPRPRTNDEADKRLEGVVHAAAEQALKLLLVLNVAHGRVRPEDGVAAQIKGRGRGWIPYRIRPLGL